VQIDFHQNLATISTKIIDHYNRKTIYLVISNNKSIANLTKKIGHVHQQLTAISTKKKVVDNNNLR
jgi:hypothetical protein